MAIWVMAVVGRRHANVVARREDNDVARANLLDRAALALHAAAAHGDDENLAKRMGVPSGARARLERDCVAAARAGAVAGNSGSMRTMPVNQSAGPCRTAASRFA